MKARQEPPPAVVFSRVWSMPCPDTFSIPPIAALAGRWMVGQSLDPFARNSSIATITNDLNPNTDALFHEDAVEFLDRMLAELGPESFDTVLLDPPYSPRQISEVYQLVGRAVTMADTQNARLYKNCKDRMASLLKPDGVAITCGWNSSGFGVGREFVLREVLLVPCGGAHNDYIVTVETKGQSSKVLG